MAGKIARPLGQQKCRRLPRDDGNEHRRGAKRLVGEHRRDIGSHLVIAILRGELGERNRSIEFVGRRLRKPPLRALGKIAHGRGERIQGRWREHHAYPATASSGRHGEKLSRGDDAEHPPAGFLAHFADPHKVEEQRAGDLGPQIPPHVQIRPQAAGTRLRLEAQAMIRVAAHDVVDIGAENEALLRPAVLDLHLHREKRRVVDADADLLDRRHQESSAPPRASPPRRNRRTSAGRPIGVPR